jgi:hypothetical protein
MAQAIHITMTCFVIEDRPADGSGAALQGERDLDL